MDKATILVIFCIIVVLLAYVALKTPSNQENFYKEARYTSWYQGYPMPSLFSSTRTLCTNGCIYRARNQPVAIDNTCMNMCMNAENGQYTNEEFNRYMNTLTTSINDGAIVYNHLN